MDTLILGCTHFPLLAGAISAYMGSGVRLIDSGAAGARALARLLGEKGLRSPRRSFGRTACYASRRRKGIRPRGGTLFEKGLFPDDVQDRRAVTCSAAELFCSKI